jgi:hypothetical protein
MFDGEAGGTDKAKQVVRRLTNYKKTHSWHIHADECKDAIGLKVHMIEDDQMPQDLILTVHHCFMRTLMNTPSYKIIENHLGVALVKNEAVKT